MCSTPFGIKDQFGTGGIRPLKAISSAQRLSASKISSDNRRSPGRGASMCSTPFGIKDQFGRRFPVAPERTDRCSTPFGIKDQFGWTAKDDHGTDICAQRLSASKISSGPSATGLLFSDTVLNAFRHQRSVRASKEFTGHTTDHVLNAFRHQRSVRVDALFYDGSCRECSTPFGIKDQFG